MGTLVSYQYADSVATITMDDGKVNAMSLRIITEINAALDQAEAHSRGHHARAGRACSPRASTSTRCAPAGPDAVEHAARPASSSAGAAPVGSPTAGPQRVHRPHRARWAVFLLLSGDYRIGASGPFRITANEVAIGLTLPQAAIELCRQRLTPVVFNRAVNLAEVFSPETAVAVGYLDRIVPADALEAETATKAAELAPLDIARTVDQAARASGDAGRLHAAIEADDASLRPSLRRSQPARGGPESVRGGARRAP